ncbi:MAG: molybdopterin molybdotransferase MoeA [Candidatus Omnitrophica bacterium]|nr:molybdopterin molybdotransferase MoeA [Candidatus Omnitrophota bacterium]
MLELEEAQRRIRTLIEPLGVETVPLSRAWARISAENVPAPISLPVFHSSAMDGYAVRASDLAGAALGKPVALSLSGEVPAGEVFTGVIEPGQCVRVCTGSPVPAGADAVVMEEETRFEPGQPGRVWFSSVPHLGEFIRRRGEDCAAGVVLVKAGQRLTSSRICLLGALGLGEVRVGRQPVVGLLATGNELQEPGTRLAPGRVYECNRTALAALTARANALPRFFPIVPDDPVATQQALAHAFAQCDVVLTSGGVSVGKWDLVKSAFEQLGGDLQFWRVAIKPGKPFVLGRLGTKLLFGLPGNPVSAMVTCLLLVCPALLAMQGVWEPALETRPGILAEALANPGNRRHFMRVTMDSNSNVRSAGIQASHILSPLAVSDGLVDVPPGAILKPGEGVRILVWD